jgi:6-pyruvoyltetrahydropterin/6-carboxytetrahydropterin synthase
MALVYVTRRMHFSAAHRLHSEALDAEQNLQVYGLCNNPMGHGHNYDLEVTVCGEPDPITGMVIDLKVLKEVIQRKVIDLVDHQHLNHQVAFMSGLVPTAENIAVAIWGVLQNKIPGATLYEVKLYETERNMVLYRGEQGILPAPKADIVK